MPPKVMKCNKIQHLCILGLIFIMTCLIQTTAWPQQGFSKKSVDWRYNPDIEFHLHYRIALDDSAFQVYFSIHFPANGDIQDQADLDYEVRSSIDADEVLYNRTLNHHIQGLGRDGSSELFHIEVPDANNFNMMFLNLKLRESGRSYTWDIPLVSETMYPPPDFILYDHSSNLPVCGDYLHVSDSLIIRDLKNKEREYFVYFYDTDFDVADPPMYRLKRTVSKDMEISSTFMIQSDIAFSFEKEGLYFIQSDTASLSGFGIRVENDFYPRITSITHLVEPLVYLSTSEEIEKLLNTEDVRTSFETFWLDLAKSEVGARDLIKKYYDRIGEANSLFTNYKKGWKSDMGMIYTIVGPPDEVYRSEGKESWYYKNPGRNQIVVFNFLKLKNLFCDDHYMLVRDNQYKSFWFKAIDRWRKGMN